MKYLTLFTSVAIASVAAYFSIVGLATIFSGAFLSVVVMAGILEVGKLVSAAWLHYEWERVNYLVRSYFTVAILILMLITSMGIFGYLSKAHIETSVSTSGNNELQIQLLERRVRNEEKSIKDAELVLDQLDSTVQTLIDYDRIRGDSGAIATRESQREERESLNNAIAISLNEIEKLQAELLPLKQEQLKLEVEVGPLKYIAELIYGKEEARNNFDVAVRGIIILLVSVFDPLAVMLLIVSTGAFKRDRLEIKPLVDEDQIMRMDLDGDTANEPSVRRAPKDSVNLGEADREEDSESNTRPEYTTGDDLHLQSEWSVNIDGSEGVRSEPSGVEENSRKGLTTVMNRRPV